MNFSKQKPYIGNLQQLVSLRSSRLEGGKADGSRITDVVNNSGLSVTVLPDRCMDILQIRYKGVNVNYIDHGGVAAPTYYDPHGGGWQRTFFGGFLTTCGLTNIGCESQENGVMLGKHGRISHTPAEQYTAIVDETGDYPLAILKGTMKETVLFGERLLLQRCIEVDGDGNQIRLHDKLINDAYHDQEYMMLYHFNLGYPFLSPDCELEIPSVTVVPRNEWAKAKLSHSNFVEDPHYGPEMCYYHQFTDTDPTVTVKARNHKLGFGLSITFERQFLDHFIQWKNMAPGEYVMGLEPATNHVDGKAYEKTVDRIPVLSAQSCKEHTIVIDFFDL